MTNTIGYVTTQRTQTTEEMNTGLDVNSSVELYLKTDYLHNALPVLAKSTELTTSALPLLRNAGAVRGDDA
jgi:hypothetical protein